MDISEEFSKDGDKVVEAGQELKRIVVGIAKFKVD
jgi:hypothetical protein